MNQIQNVKNPNLKVWKIGFYDLEFI